MKEGEDKEEDPHRAQLLRAMLVAVVYRCRSSTLIR